MQVVLADLVEHGHAVGVVDHLEESSDQSRHRVRRPYRIVQRDPGPSLDRVHQERRPVVVPEQRFVAQIDEVGRARIAASESRDRLHPVPLLGRTSGGTAGLSSIRSTEASRITATPTVARKESRRVPSELEQPPQLVRVRHAAEHRERAERDGAEDDEKDGREPQPRGVLEQTRAPVELAPRGDQHAQHQAEHDGLFVVQALQQRDRDPEPEASDRERPCRIDSPRERLRHQQQSQADQTVHEVRELHDRQRQKSPEQVQPVALDRQGRRRTGVQRPRQT